jgi:uncharacterized protein (DUF697 family)
VKSSSKSGAAQAQSGTTKRRSASKSKKRIAPITRSNPKSVTKKEAKAAIVVDKGERKMIQVGPIGEPNKVTNKDQAMIHETAESEANETRGSTEVPIHAALSAIGKTDSIRDKRALELVDRLSLWSGAAGLIPVPLVDIAAVGGVQLHMLHRLSEIYGVPFSENRGKSILTSLAGAVIPATAATTTTSLMKGVPGIGTAIGALTMPAVAACATWVIGRVFIKHFASGGTLLDFSPPDYRDFIKAQKSKFATRSREVAPASPSTTARTTTDVVS